MTRASVQPGGETRDCRMINGCPLPGSCGQHGHCRLSHLVPDTRADQPQTVTPIDLQALRTLHEKMAPGQEETATAVRRIACEVLEDQAATFVSEGAVLRLHSPQRRSRLVFAADVIAARVDAHTAANLTVLMNALPLLLEIAETALSLRAQERAAARARFECHRRGGRGIPDALYVALAIEDTKLKACQDAHDAALARATIPPPSGEA